MSTGGMVYVLPMEAIMKATGATNKECWEMYRRDGQGRFLAFAAQCAEAIGARISFSSEAP